MEPTIEELKQKVALLEVRIKTKDALINSLKWTIDDLERKLDQIRGDNI